ncbi:MAG: hypothetical protein ACHQ53_03610 [Polyangiales bacterium]
MSTSATKAGPSSKHTPGGLGARAREELLQLPAEHLSGLPVSVRITAQGLGIAHPIRLDSGRFKDGNELPRGIVFDGDEIRAIAVGVQAERLWPADFKGFCLRKLHDPSFRITPGLALGGAQPDAVKPWSLGRVLSWLEIELCEAELADALADPAGVGAAA